MIVPPDSPFYHAWIETHSGPEILKNDSFSYSD